MKNSYYFGTTRQDVVWKQSWILMEVNKRYHIAQNFDRKNIDGLALIQKFDGETLTDSLLENLYLLYNSKILKGKTSMDC